MDDDDNFCVFTQHRPAEMFCPRSYAGGPRTGDFMVITITDGIERGVAARVAFGQRVTELLAAAPGVAPADVFLIVQLITEPASFSFADGVFAGPH